MISELSKLYAWLNINKLSLNISQTNFMMFLSSESTQTFNISINGVNIMRVCAVKCLGVYLDDELNWKEHITYICHKLSKSISMSYKVSQTLNTNALRSLYSYLILPYISYCAEIFGNTYPSNILPVLLRQRKAIKIIAGAICLDHT